MLSAAATERSESRGAVEASLPHPDFLTPPLFIFETLRGVRLEKKHGKASLEPVAQFQESALHSSRSVVAGSIRAIRKVGTVTAINVTEIKMATTPRIVG